MMRLLFAALMLLPTLTSAMEFRLYGDHPDGCVATATGPILPGDVDKLRAMLPGDAENKQYVDPHRACVSTAWAAVLSRGWPLPATCATPGSPPMYHVTRPA